LYWVAIGLGILAKGPATLVFAGAFGLALLATPGRRGWIRDWRWWVWMPMALLVAAPWYVYIAWHAGAQLSGQFLGYEILERIRGTPHGHGGPPGYYLLLSLAGLLPWTVFVPGTLFLAFRRRREDAAFRLLLIWLAVPWVILELIHAKLPHYIMPCYVPLAILMARIFDEYVRSYVSWPALPRIERWALDLWPGIMVGVGVVAVAGVMARWDSRWGWAAVATGGVLVVGFLSVARLMHRRGPAVAGVAAVVVTVVFHVALGLLLLPSLEPLRLSRNLAERINATAPTGERVYLCGHEEPSAFFYLCRPALQLSPDGVQEVMTSSSGGALLAITEQVMKPPPGREQQGLAADVAAQLRPRLLPDPVRGFNYVRWGWETIWLARIPAR
jgi:4-amino-4-deoxy-L-arabinose transferase-like glycosyltransferase